MEFIEVIEKRRTVRDFKSLNIPAEIVEYAIENAFKAPSYNHLRDWNFIIIQNLESKLSLIESENLNKEVDLKELEALFRNEDIIKKEMYLDAIPKQKRMILNAPLVVVVIFKPKTRVDVAKTIYDLNCLASVWCCIENFLLSLAEKDVFGVTYIPQNTIKLKEKMNIPEELEVAAIIPIGYKSDEAKVLKQKEIKLSEHIHYEKFNFNN
jgi:nitroreductase